jgi:hypothetical protein
MKINIFKKTTNMVTVQRTQILCGNYDTIACYTSGVYTLCMILLSENTSKEMSGLITLDEEEL